MRPTNPLINETMKNTNIQFLFSNLHQFHIDELKFSSKNYLILIGLITICFCFQINPILAQDAIINSSAKTSENSNFSKLFDFENYTSGSSPIELIKSGNYLFGITLRGGPNGANGVLYKIKTDGTESNGIAFYDYKTPLTFTLIDTMVYGIVYDYNNLAFMYRVSTSGNGFEITHSFNDGVYPDYAITAFENTIYGNKFDIFDGTGYLFKINPDGSGFTKFQSVGYFPYGKLILEDNYLYGTTAEVFGPADDHGTIYKIKQDGTDFRELHRFDSEQGRTPAEALTTVGSFLYGTTRWGGKDDNGVIFRIKKDGSGFQVLHDFQYDEGAGSITKLVYSGKALYGSTHIYGLHDHGTLFKINPDGTGFEKLYDFQGTDGSGPRDLIISNDTIFGITDDGGIYDNGTLFIYVIDESQTPTNEPTLHITLSITKPEQITISTEEDVAVKEGVLIDLDTLFSIDGNVSYSHTWNVFNNNEIQEIDKQVNIFNEQTFYVVVTTEEGCTYSDSVNVRIAKITGIDDQQINSNQIYIFPNPNEGSFNIEIAGEYPGYYTYAVLDIFGRNIANGQFNCKTEVCTPEIKIKKVSKGVYTIIVYKGDLFYVKRKLIVGI